MASMMKMMPRMMFKVLPWKASNFTGWMMSSMPAVKSTMALRIKAR